VTSFHHGVCLQIAPDDNLPFNTTLVLRVSLTSLASSFPLSISAGHGH